MAPKSSAEKKRDQREREKNKKHEKEARDKKRNEGTKAAKTQRRAPQSVTESGPRSPGEDSDGPSNGA